MRWFVGIVQYIGWVWIAFIELTMLIAVPMSTSPQYPGDPGGWRGGVEMLLFGQIMASPGFILVFLGRWLQRRQDCPEPRGFAVLPPRNDDP
jgi:hypothetical protein